MGESRRILVIGGGVAGLTAARATASANAHSVTVLEARSRLGGRIYTAHPDGVGGPVEFGAEFLHGRHPEQWQMARAAGMLLYEVGGEHRYARRGRLEPDESIWRKTEEVFTRMTKTEGNGRTFADFLGREFSGPEWNDVRQWAIDFVEGFNAADHRRVSLEWLARDERASSEIDGERQFRAANGYSRLIDWLEGDCVCRGVIILRETVARSVTWQKGRVSVRASAGGAETDFEADAAILAIPLGVLQAGADEPGAIRFEPEIVAKREAAGRITVGPVVRITLQCREAFWEQGLPAATGDKLEDLSFIHAREQQFPTWWTQYPLQTRLITGWAGGPAGARVAAMSEAEVAGAALASLADATGLSYAELERLAERIYLHNWQKDPFARGAYSYVPAGSMDAIEALAAPCDQTLFFAGEATDTTHTGTVHGAIASGLRAARQAMESGPNA